MEDLVEKTDSTSEDAEETTVDTTEATEQDPLKVELDKVQRKEGKTEAEKAAYSLKKNAERAKELGIDPAEVLGFSHAVADDSDDEDDKPMTMGMFKRMQMDNAAKSALQLAEDIENETERELTKYHLENSIKSTGNPQEDLKLANAIVNSYRNTKILEESARKVAPKTHSSSSSAPAKLGSDIEIQLAPHEIPFTKAPFNMTKEEIVKSRPQ